MGARRLAGALALVAIATACASERATVTPEPEPVAPDVAAIPEGALPGAAGAPVELDAAVVAADAVDVGELRDVLADAGFVGGTERGFSRTMPGRQRAVARVLVFGTSAGACRYLRWLQEHVADVIGDAEPDPAIAVPGDGSVFVHEPDPCCHSETRLFLAMWTDGARVVTLEVGGPAARAGGVPRLIDRLDAAIT